MSSPRVRLAIPSLDPSMRRGLAWTGAAFAMGFVEITCGSTPKNCTAFGRRSVT